MYGDDGRRAKYLRSSTKRSAADRHTMLGTTRPEYPAIFQFKSPTQGAVQNRLTKNRLFNIEDSGDRSQMTVAFPQTGGTPEIAAEYECRIFC